MDQPPKESTDPSILDEIKQALAGADRCIELARKQRDCITKALPALSAGGMEAENLLLEHAREGREKLEALELRAETTPPPPLEGAVPLHIDQLIDQPPADVPILEELTGPA
jgi:hypothetical protein